MTNISLKKADFIVHHSEYRMDLCEYEVLAENKNGVLFYIYNKPNGRCPEYKLVRKKENHF